MAEIAGLVVGVAGLGGLFSTAVDCFEYVRIAKSFDQDFAISQLNLDAAGFRLSRWGEAVRIHDPTTTALSEDRYKKAEKILNRVCNLFVQAQEDSEIFGDSSSDVYDVNSDMSPAQVFVHTGIVTKNRKRVDRHRPNLLQRTKWALYKKKELYALIEKIVALVGHLELLLPPSQDSAMSLQKVAELEVTEICDTGMIEQQQNNGLSTLDVVKTLQSAAEGLDPNLEEAIVKFMAKLSPANNSTAVPGYNISQKIEGGVHGNKGIFAAHNTGSQINHYGSDRDG